QRPEHGGLPPAHISVKWHAGQVDQPRIWSPPNLFVLRQKTHIRLLSGVDADIIALESAACKQKKRHGKSGQSRNVLPGRTRSAESYLPQCELPQMVRRQEPSGML